MYKALRNGVQEVAVKSLNPNPDSGPELLAHLMREVRILQRASHDRNVVQFYGVCTRHPLGPMLVMEYLEVGFPGIGF